MTTTTTPPVISHDTVPLTSIAPHPRNPRRVVGDVSDMAASMLEVGVLQDLVVAPWPDDLDAKRPRGAHYILIAGARRHAAAKAAKLKDVPIKYRGDLDTLAKQLEAMLVENLHRTDLTPVEEADTYQALLDLEGLTQTALAKAVGQPVSRIRERLKLARLEQPVKEKVHAGQLTITDAVAIGAFADDAKTTKELLEKVGTPRFGWELEQAQQHRKRAADLEKRLAPFRAAGFPVKTVPSYEDPKGWKPLEGLLPGFPSQYAADGAADASALANHSDCPGRMVAIRYSDTVTHYCTEPSRHPKPKETKSKAELKREAQEKAAKAAYNEHAPVATALRRGAIAAFLDAGPADDTVRAALEHKVLHIDNWTTQRDARKKRLLLADLTGLARMVPTAVDDMDDENLDASLQLAVKRLSVNALLLLDEIASDEQNLSRPNGIESYQVPREYVRTLNDRIGYEWTDWERATFNVDAILSPPSDIDGDDEPDVDDLDEDDEAEDDETGAGS